MSFYRKTQKPLKSDVLQFWQNDVTKSKARKLAYSNQLTAVKVKGQFQDFGNHLQG